MCFAFRLDELLAENRPNLPSQNNPRAVLSLLHYTPFQHPSTEPNQWYLTPNLAMHICNDRRLFLSDFKETIPAIGRRQDIMGRGSVQVVIIFDNVMLGLHLNEVLYVPQSDFNCVSKSRFKRYFFDKRRSRHLVRLKKYISELEAIIKGADAKDEILVDEPPDLWFHC